MTKDVKEALNTCGRNMALIAEENCLEILYLAREEILQEIIMGMIDSLKDDSETIYEIFFRSNNTIVKLKALEKIHNEDFLKKIDRSSESLLAHSAEGHSVTGNAPGISAMPCPAGVRRGCGIARHHGW